MSRERLLLTQKYSIARIISSPNHTPRLSFRLTNSQAPAPLARSLTHQPKLTIHPPNDDPLAIAPKPTLKDQARLIKSVNFERAMEMQ